MKKSFIIILFLFIANGLFLNAQNNDQKENEFTDQQVNEVIDSLICKMKKAYVFLDKAEETERLLKSKTYSSNPNKLAAELHKDVRSITDDRHLRVFYRPPSEEEKTAKEEPTPEEREKRYKRYLESLKTSNYSFEKVEILPGNIGYIKLGGFIACDGAFKAAAAALQFVRNTEAVIIDVRQNGGGDGRMGHFLSTYFFEDGDSKWLLNNFNRGQDKLVQEWTMPTVPGDRLADTPLYILVSGGTFSAAEAFPYALQAYERAIIVGDTTGGGAHSGTTVDLAYGVGVWLPSGRVTSPVTESNWEAVGVIPDIPCDVEDAILVAKEDHFKKMLDEATTDEEKKGYERKIIEVQAEINPVELSEELFGNYSGTYRVKDSKVKRRIISHKNGKFNLVLVDGDMEFPMGDLLPLTETLFKVRRDVNMEFTDFENGVPQSIYWIRGDGSKEKWLR